MGSAIQQSTDLVPSSPTLQSALKDYTPTSNRMGYMSPELDLIQKEFVTHCCENLEALYLDVGCGDGVATLPVAEKGGRIIACDLEPLHLQALKIKISEIRGHSLIYAPGHFPNAVQFPENILRGVNMSMVLHFLSPSSIKNALLSLFNSLEPKGKLFITTSSPYQGVLSDFVPIYEAKKGDEEFPGYIDDIRRYVPHRAHLLPKTNIVFCPQELSRLVKKYGFHVLHATFFSRHAVPEDIQSDGREYSGVICEKP